MDEIGVLRLITNLEKKKNECFSKKTKGKFTSAINQLNSAIRYAKNPPGARYNPRFKPKAEIEINSSTLQFVKRLTNLQPRGSSSWY